MKTVKLYYTGTFSAAHYLLGYDGPCSKMHGHTWKVEVWLRGCVDPITGMVLDFKYIQREIDKLDHGLLNEKFALPTAECLVEHFARRIPLAYKVRVWESDHAYAEVERTYANTIQMLPPEERARLLMGRWNVGGEERLSEGFAEGIAEEPEVEVKMEEVDAEGVIGRVISRRFGK